MTEPQAPDMGYKTRLGRLRELSRKLEALIATAQAIHADDSALIVTLFTAKERQGMLAVAGRVQAKTSREEARINAMSIEE